MTTEEEAVRCPRCGREAKEMHSWLYPNPVWYCAEDDWFFGYDRKDFTQTQEESE